MNDRIEKMMLEATKYMPPGYYVPGVYFEKFAELIVQECAQLVEDNIDPQNAWITPAVIKKHFGVKE